LHGTDLPLVGNDMPSEEVSAVSAPYCGLADAMEFPSRSVPFRHWMAPSEEPQFAHGLRLFLLEARPSLVCRRFDSKKRSARVIAGDQWSLIGYHGWS
jgi:hypothetical protein